jgi:hypothetical protein
LAANSHYLPIGINNLSVVNDIITNIIVNAAMVIVACFKSLSSILDKPNVIRPIKPIIPKTTTAPFAAGSH